MGSLAMFDGTRIVDRRRRPVDVHGLVVLVNGFDVSVGP
jgi:hypothetical protein